MAKIEEIGSNADESDSNASEEDVYVVERICDWRVKKGRKQYLIKWKNYPESENTWEDEDNILDKSLIEAFHDQSKETPRKTGKKRKSEVHETEQEVVKKEASPKKSSPKKSSPKKGKSEPGSPSSTSSKEGWIHESGLDKKVLELKDWSELIERVVTITRGKEALKVFVEWKNGLKVIHDSKVIHEKCPHKLLDYYEQHLKFKR